MNMELTLEKLKKPFIFNLDNLSKEEKELVLKIGSQHFYRLMDGVWQKDQLWEQDCMYLLEGNYIYKEFNIERKTKSQEDSKIEVRHIVMPHHLNQNDTLFGGQLLSWIDICAAMTAQKHAGNVVVTVHIDSVSFKHPIFKGEHVVLNSFVISTGTTSMKIKVEVHKDNPFTGEKELTTEAVLVFVALGQDNKPTEVPALEE